MPHPPDDGLEAAADALALTANTESCLSSSAPPQVGQIGDRPSLVRNSN
jgi:hypothetical protein